MTTFLDGTDVSYDGPDRTGGPSRGDVGRVLVADNQAAHVMWTTGAISGQVTLVEHADLESAEPKMPTAGETVREHLGHSLDYTTTPEEVLASMDADGGLDRLSMISDEVVEWVASRLRGLGSFRERLASLETTDGNDVVIAATRRVLADAMETLEDEDD